MNIGDDIIVVDAKNYKQFILCTGKINCIEGSYFWITTREFKFRFEYNNKN